MQSVRNWSNTRHLKISLFCLLLLSSCISCSAPVAAIGVIGGGVATKFLLQDMDDRATHVVQNAAASGSLLTSNAARNAQLLIDAARQNLHDELDKQWDQLDSEKIDMLRELNRQVDNLQDMENGLGDLETTAFLDTDSLVSRIPFAEKMPRIRKVEGSSQYFKTDGDYTIRITGNVFAPFGPDTTVSIDGKPLQVSPSPPYSAIITIPNKSMPFDNFRTLEVPITVKTHFTESSWFNKKSHDYEFTILIELFPKFAAYYQMDESVNKPEPDLTQLAYAKGTPTLVPGCGDSGCNAYWNTCAQFPVDGQFVQVVNRYDSFSGWGGFGAVTVGNGQVCEVYWQHSHNVARNINIDIEYHPAKATTQHNPVILQPIIAGLATPSVCTSTSDRFALQKVSATPTPTEAAATAVAVGTGSAVCWLQFGQEYLGQLTANHIGYILAIHSFNGENYSTVDGNVLDPSHPGIQISPSVHADPQRVVFKLIPPKW